MRVVEVLPFFTFKNKMKMKQYKLKEEAKPFFKASYRSVVTSIEDWNEYYHIGAEALEEVRNCPLEYHIPVDTKEVNNIIKKLVDIYKHKGDNNYEIMHSEYYVKITKEQDCVIEGDKTKMYISNAGSVVLFEKDGKMIGLFNDGEYHKLQN